MLPLVLTALLAASPQQPEPDQPEPGAERVAEARATLDEAYRSEDEKRITEALEAARAVPHETIVRAVLKALEDERIDVRLAGIEALRWLAHRDALKALHRLVKAREITRDPLTMAALLRAHGQHASPDSVEFLGRTPFVPDDHACLRTRVLALARIRTEESLETLMRILAVTNPRGAPRIEPHMKEVRLSLMLLTGIDRGLSAPLWEEWWRANRKTFEVPPEPPPLPRELQHMWDGFWGLPTNQERSRRREDRGKD